MSVLTARGRDRTSTLIESNYDPKMPRDMFGFTVDPTHLDEYQDFLAKHLGDTIKQNERLAQAISQGLIDTQVSRAQWGKPKKSSKSPKTSPLLTSKKSPPPFLSKIGLGPKSTSSRDVLAQYGIEAEKFKEKEKEKEKEKDQDKKEKEKEKEMEQEKEKERQREKQRSALMKSKSISNFINSSIEFSPKLGLTGLIDRKTKTSESSPVGSPVRGDARRERSSSVSYVATPHPALNHSGSGIIMTAIQNFIDSTEVPEDAVTRLIRAGVPTNMRAEMWLAMTGVVDKLENVKGVYQSLCDNLDKGTHLESMAYEQIEKDITRTFHSLEFTPAGHEFQPILRRILRAYSLRNPALGYCQSMNFLAGGLLIFMEEEHAFWILCFIVEDLLQGYFTKTMVGLQVDTNLFDKLVKKYLPELGKHLVRQGFSNVFCTVQWLLCMFICSLPSEAAFRIWDMVFLSGTKVLFEVGLNILKMNEAQLMRKNDPVDIASFLNKSLTSIFDATPLLATNFLKNVTLADLKTMQTSLHLEVQAELRSRHDTMQMIELLRLTQYTKVELIELYTQFITLDPMLNEFGINIYVFKSLPSIAFPDWHNPDEYFIERLFAAFDRDNDSLLDFKDLMLGLSAISRGAVKDKLVVCSRMFGVSGARGRVSAKDFRKLLHSVYKVVEKKSSQKNINKEVDFFAEMFYKNEKNVDGMTMERFNECALLQPAIVKCFNFCTIRKTKIRLL